MSNNLNNLIAAMRNTKVGDAPKTAYTSIKSKRELTALARESRKQAQSALNKKYGSLRSKRTRGPTRKAMSTEKNNTRRNTKHQAPKAKKTRKNNKVHTFGMKVRAVRERILKERREKASRAMKAAEAASKKAAILQKKAAEAAALIMPGSTRAKTKAATHMGVE